jgi:hypothetical protein
MATAGSKDDRSEIGARAATEWRNGRIRVSAAVWPGEASLLNEAPPAFNEARRSQATLTSICLGLAFSFFGKCTSRMPCLN